MKKKGEDGPSPRIHTTRRYSLFPRSLAKPLEELLAPVCKKQGFAQYRILTQWHQIAGEEWAACSIPQKLTYTRGSQPQATLHVLVQPARALELQHMHPLILGRINGFFGFEAVHKLVLVQSAAAFSVSHPKPTVERKPSGSGFTVSPEACNDAELRAALVRLAEYMG